MLISSDWNIITVRIFFPKAQRLSLQPCCNGCWRGFMVNKSLVCFKCPASSLPVTLLPLWNIMYMMQKNLINKNNTIHSTLADETFPPQHLSIWDFAFLLFLKKKKKWSQVKTQHCSLLKLIRDCWVILPQLPSCCTSQREKSCKVTFWKIKKGAIIDMSVNALIL